MKSGVYTITNLVNGKIYVGYATSFYFRESNHFCLLKYDKHYNTHLQNSINKYGIENFKFEILVECEEQFLASEEHYWATILNTHDRKFGYNIEPTNPYKKIRLSEETKTKISIGNKGKKISNKTRKRIAIANEKPVVVLNLKSKYLYTYKSIKNCSNKLHISESKISIKIKSKRSYRNYIILLKKDYDKHINYDYIVERKKRDNNSKSKKTKLMNIKTKEIIDFKSEADTSRFLGKTRTTISRRIRRNSLFIDGYKIIVK